MAMRKLGSPSYRPRSRRTTAAIELLHDWPSWPCSNSVAAVVRRDLVDWEGDPSLRMAICCSCLCACLFRRGRGAAIAVNAIMLTLGRSATQGFSANVMQCLLENYCAGWIAPNVE